MESEQRDAARKLLALERQFPAGGFSAEDEKRWAEYLRQVFGSELGTHRRSVRLSAGARCNIRAGSGRFPCRVLEVSYTGLTIAGEVFRYLGQGASVSVEDIDGVPATLPCSVVRIDARQRPPLAGLLFSSEVTDAAWRGYFDGAYYPNYLRHLEALSATATGSADGATKATATAKPKAPPKSKAKAKPKLKAKAAKKAAQQPKKPKARAKKKR
jgi:hypothetical protein